jgi:hypothetical protein
VIATDGRGRPQARSVHEILINQTLKRSLYFHLEACLEESPVTGDLTGRTIAKYRVTTIRFDPFPATLRDDPRFLGLLDRMRRESNREL